MSTLSDPVLVFTLLALMMLTMPLLAERLRMPDLVLLLLAGVVVGPHGLNLLARGDAITLFGSVGLLYIMFLAGLEIDLHRFAHTRTRSVGYGLLTFALPQAVGTVVSYYALGFSWPTSLLLAFADGARGEPLWLADAHAPHARRDLFGGGCREAERQEQSGLKKAGGQQAHGGTP